MTTEDHGREPKTEKLLVRMTRKQKAMLFAQAKSARRSMTQQIILLFEKEGARLGIAA